MNKLDYILYWKESASRDWLAALSLLEKRNFPQALFFAHLVLEKLIKAHWVKDNQADHPPRLHNLIRLISQTSLIATSNDLLFLDKMNDFQMEGRYPDYHFLIYKICTQEYTKETLENVDNIRLWLISLLP